MKMTIEVAGVRKACGRTLALDGMTFTVCPGQVLGFIRPNGAGKSTTMQATLCASSGGMVNNTPSGLGADHIVPVDVYLPARPEMGSTCTIRLRMIITAAASPNGRV
jgi:ABC-type Mn2+/Zn2+ transport system ATPase subunit